MYWRLMICQTSVEASWRNLPVRLAAGKQQSIFIHKDNRSSLGQLGLLIVPAVPEIASWKSRFHLLMADVYYSEPELKSLRRNYHATYIQGIP